MQMIFEDDIAIQLKMVALAQVFPAIEDDCNRFGASKDG
jgi:hypothetical protein